MRPGRYQPAVSHRFPSFLQPRQVTRRRGRPPRIFLTVLPIQRHRRLTRLIVPARHSATYLLLMAFHHRGDIIDINGEFFLLPADRLI